MLDTSEEVPSQTTESDSTYVGWLRRRYKKRREGSYDYQRERGALGMLVMPLAKQHSEESVCHDSHDKNKGDDDWRD